MWYFIITDFGYQLFEILPDKVRPFGAVVTASLKASFDGIRGDVSRLYAGRRVRVDFDNATFQSDGSMIGMVGVSLL